MIAIKCIGAVAVCVCSIYVACKHAVINRRRSSQSSQCNSLHSRQAGRQVGGAVGGQLGV